jgi:hypothetical protein
MTTALVVKLANGKADVAISLKDVEKRGNQMRNSLGSHDGARSSRAKTTAGSTLPNVVSAFLSPVGPMRWTTGRWRDLEHLKPNARALRTPREAGLAK